MSYSFKHCEILSEKDESIRISLDKRKGVTETDKKRQFFDYIVYVAVRVSASNREEAKEVVNEQIIKPYHWPSPIISVSIRNIKPIAK